MKLPWLVVDIGMTKHYNGTEEVVGGHADLQGHPYDCSEAKAFKRIIGSYRCGIGNGQVREDHVNVMFVANGFMVGVYLGSAMRAV